MTTTKYTRPTASYNAAPNYIGLLCRDTPADLQRLTGLEVSWSGQVQREATEALRAAARALAAQPLPDLSALNLEARGRTPANVTRRLVIPRVPTGRPMGRPAEPQHARHVLELLTERPMTARELRRKLHRSYAQMHNVLFALKEAGQVYRASWDQGRAVYARTYREAE